MEEANQAKEQLAKLEALEVDSAAFAAAFDEFRTAVLSHAEAEAEEQQEFAALRASADAKDLVWARQEVAAAEAAAPTHPIPTQGPPR